MRVKSIEIKGLPEHSDTAVDMPSTGVLVITGPNGSGKSTIIESVAWAVYGKTLRGAAYASGTVSVDVDAHDTRYEITRAKTARTKLSLRATPCDTFPTDTLDMTGDTTTSTQRKIVDTLQPFHRWRRTCVLSSADAAHFSSAPDADKKRILEEILDVDAFDRASTKVAADKDAQAADIRDAQATIASLESRIASAERSRDDADRVISSLSPAEVDGYERATLLGQVASLHKKLDDARAQAQNAKSDVAVLKSKIANAKRELSSVSTHCNACGRAWDNAEQSQAKRDSLLAAVVDLQTQLAAVRIPDTSRLESEWRAKSKRLSELDAQEAANGRIAATILDARARAAEAEQAITRDRAQLREANSAMTTMLGNAQLLDDAARVFSKRGARGLFFAGALDDISAMATHYASALAHRDVRITMTPQTTKKDGSAADRISIDIRSDGWGADYSALSGGQRRRVDIAIMLALCDINAQMTGMRRATLFCDELFDSLDDDGVTAAIDLLESIAEDRCVVLITHNSDLAKQIRATKTIRLGGPDA